VLAGDVIDVSKERGVESGDLPPAPRMNAPRGPLKVPVPVFHPSITLAALEVEVRDIDPRELEMSDRKVEKLRRKRVVAQLKDEKKSESEKGSEQEEVSVPEGVRETLIHLAAVEPHLLEMIPPRHYVDPAAVLIPELLPPPDPRWPVGWPGIGWIDFPLDPGDVRIVKPPPCCVDDDDDEDEEEPWIPEPGTAVLLMLGLAALGVGRRRSSS
jgi:hypothetical protein